MALAENGFSPEDVDDVFITHAHGDHIGWNTDAAGEVLFPSARYVLAPEAAVRARDFDTGRRMFAQDAVAFGTWEWASTMGPAYSADAAEAVTSSATKSKACVRLFISSPKASS